MRLQPTIRTRPTLADALARIGPLCWLLLTLGVGIGAEPTVSREYQIKAAFLYNFTKFVDWPPSCFPRNNSPIVIGVFGQNPFGPELENGIKDRQVNGRSLVVKVITGIEDARSTHLVFVPATEDKRIADILKALRRTSVLTVGETDAFADAGGTINFVLEGDKVRFDINLGAAEQAGLKVSSQLLKLAKTVRKQK